jgi:hypothetical protein
MHPSAACHCQSSPTSASYTASSRAQARSKQPCSTHARYRSLTVDLAPNARGKASHCPPLRASQISPSRSGRSSLRGRPGFLRGLATTSSGRSSPHSASSTRQIVGSSGGLSPAAGAAAFFFIGSGDHFLALSG